jgi:hypothetical protein
VPPPSDRHDPSSDSATGISDVLPTDLLRAASANADGVAAPNDVAAVAEASYPRRAGARPGVVDMTSARAKQVSGGRVCSQLIAPARA